MIKITVSTKKRIKPLREVSVDFEIDNNKCSSCSDKPCLKSCPVDAIYLNEDNIVDINEDCFGCILCRKACPYDAIKMETTFSEPKRENIPNINPNLCIGCGGCVKACKTGSIHLESTGDENAHSVIDEDTCIRCGYCFRGCPTDAIKYGVIQPKTVQAGKSIVINENDCIGCMTCKRVCPSKGAINVGNVSKLPYIDPSYCARCEECMNICPASAIKYNSRKKAVSNFSKIRSMDLASEILKNETNELSNNIGKLNPILVNKLNKLSSSVNEKEAEFDITDSINQAIYSLLDHDIEVYKLNNILNKLKPLRKIHVDEDECIGCGECISVCPVDCIKLLMPSPVLIGEDCVFCGQCVKKCPVDAITVSDEFLTSIGDSIYYNKKNILDLRDGTWNIDNDVCQSCGICIGKCPTNALSMDGDEVIFNEEKCIFCGECEAICPVTAIKVDVDYQ